MATIRHRARQILPWSFAILAGVLTICAGVSKDISTPREPSRPDCTYQVCDDLRQPAFWNLGH
jgi:hypothetical protein